ncbi:hypothetical protein O0882_23570 [Janthinobacterium sp. SUN073]|uniref:hypothetical protein n=1 Tax=Janthinobacterium sp. SUN073 TaxID=3004102 RepID=UPI0025B1E2B6|nr:hypothetical protein [Janthinobacterium sp. SUN073]MDN2699300.1 hypothetical protein [Janthinobacterium sp. SUN073]
MDERTCHNKAVSTVLRALNIYGECPHTPVEWAANWTIKTVLGDENTVAQQRDLIWLVAKKSVVD